MGLILPPPKQSIWQSNFPATPGLGTLMTSSATPHVKGAYSVVVDPTTYDIFGMWIAFDSSFATGFNTAELADLAIGANGVEVVVIPDMQSGWKADLGSGGYAQYYPIFIPKGSRVTARNQSVAASAATNIAVVFDGGHDGHSPIFTGCDAIGVDTANSRGTMHTPGNTGTESTAANVGSATSRAYGAIMLELQGGSTDTTFGNVANHWELMIGGTTICEWYNSQTSTEYIPVIVPPEPFYVGIPAGTQLQIRGECSGTADAMSVILRAFY